MYLLLKKFPVFKFSLLSPTETPFKMLAGLQLFSIFLSLFPFGGNAGDQTQGLHQAFSTTERYPSPLYPDTGSQ